MQVLPPQKAANSAYSTRVVSAVPLKPTSSSSPLCSGPAFRGAGEDHIPGFEGKEARHIGDQRHNLMDHVGSGALLAHFAINLQA